MADLTADQVYEKLSAALGRVAGIEPDPLLWGDREASWTKTRRHYRIEDLGWEDLGWYRGGSGGRQRRSHEFVVHLTHRMSQKQDRTRETAAGDADAVVRRIINDTGIIQATIRAYVDAPEIAESDSGDHLETDIPVRLEYDFAFTVEAA